MNSSINGRRRRGRRIELVFTEGGISAIHRGFVGSGREYKKVRYRVGERVGELISYQPLQGFYLPYDDYRVCMH